MRLSKRSCERSQHLVATYKTAAIVLGRYNLGEADRIVVVMTPDRGKLRAVAKGVRKTLSRNAGHIELFSHVEMMLAEGKNLDVLTTARLVYYPDLVGNYDSLRQAYLMANMVDRLTSDSGSQPGIYRLLSYGLRELDEFGASPTSQLFFKLRLLSQLGYKPQLEVCAVCGGSLEPAYISAEHGGAVCAACRSADSDAISANQLGLWRRLYEADLSATTPADDELALATLPLCDTFYEYIFGRAFTVSA